MTDTWTQWSFIVAIVAVILGVALMILGLVQWNNKLLATGFGFVMIGLYLFCHWSGQPSDSNERELSPVRMLPR